MCEDVEQQSEASAVVSDEGHVVARRAEFAA